MSELTNVHARSVKDLTTPNTTSADSSTFDQVKLVAGNFPPGYGGCEALTVEQIKDTLNTQMVQELTEESEKLLEQAQRDLTQSIQPLVDQAADHRLVAVNSAYAAETSKNIATNKVTEINNLAAQITQANLGIGYELTEATLLASKPVEAQKVVHALNTKKDWIWNRTSAEGVSPVTGTWTLAGIGVVEIIKQFVNENPLFKPKQLVSGDNLNAITTPGIYYHWGANLTSSQLLNMPVYLNSNAVQGTLIVYNPLNTETSGLVQQYYPNIDTSGPFYRKRKQDGVFSNWATMLNSDNRHNTNIITTEGTDVLQLPPGDYTWPSLVLGNTLLNLPDVTYKFGRLEIKVGGGSGSFYKTAIFYPYGRDINYYMNTNYEQNTWSGWRTYKDYATLMTELSGLFSTPKDLASALNNLAGTEYFGKRYSPLELKGSSKYASAYYAGFNHTTTEKGVSFNKLVARISNPNTGPTEFRVYLGSKLNTATNGYSVSANLVNSPDFSGLCLSFPTADTGDVQDVILDQVVSIPAHCPFVIVFRKTNLATFTIGRFTAAEISGNIESRGFSMWAQPVEWGESPIAASSVEINYVQTGFKLLLEITSSTGGGGGSEVVKHTPQVILPPKIYAVEGLETHVYPEHIIAEDYKLYEHDISCSRGQQRKRGFLWTPAEPAKDPVGQYAFSYAIHDKQTGQALASKSSLIVLADKAANAGTKNVCMIGDSLVNAGSMTQRLLDIAADDVTKVNLIGTRGSGLNKHEGRGGWTINDYATVGRSDYKFTVSGITNAPAINSTTYTLSGRTLLVQEVSLTEGSGYIVASLQSGSALAPSGSGTLTKANSGLGDNTINFSTMETVSANPFWNTTTSQLDFADYLSKNTFAAPDVVIIQLGVNDTFGFTSDEAVNNFALTAIPKLDALIANIKEANADVKIIISTPPTYADQDAFGLNYACGQTSWRAKRNIVVFNSQLINHYTGKEAQKIYLCGAGYNVDAENNFPVSTVAVNSQNSKTVEIQSNGVHPATSGYRQIGDALWACLKAILGL